MSGYVVQAGSGYLQWHPGPKEFTFSAGELRYATVFTQEQAEYHASAQRACKWPTANAVPDMKGREPDVLPAMPPCAECEDEDGIVLWDRGPDFAFWTRQRREIPVCVSCWRDLDNREPREVTFDEALGARCDAEQRMAEAVRMKR